MKMPQYRITDIFLLTAAAAMSWHLWTEFLYSYRGILFFATLLGLLITSTLIIFAERVKHRPFMFGFTLYAFLHVACVLHFGMADRLTELSGIGMGYALITGIAARWGLILFTDTLRIDPPSPKP